MDASHRYENFPLRIVMASNFVSLGIYAIGFLIVLRTGWPFALLYFAYILVLESHLSKTFRSNCQCVAPKFGATYI
jgi:hypothetical protein